MFKISFLLILVLPFFSRSQQISDDSYRPSIKNPMYPKGEGSVVFIDEGHNNFHTKNGRYQPFSSLLESDGYVSKSFKGEFKEEKLNKGKILVISNALHQTNVRDWYLPTPSAFTIEEIETIKKWVEEGGSLFLIADHMPMAGAAQDLAKVFGFEFTNGFALNPNANGSDKFNRKENTLRDNIITNGRDSTEKVKQISTFTGQAFKLPTDATPILLFSDDYVNMLPDTAWVFTETTPNYSVKDWSQGAFKKVGKGKIVVFGEAAMFSAQLAGPNKVKVGMNSEDASENFHLLLNIIHWLDGKLE